MSVVLHCLQDNLMICEYSVEELRAKHTEWAAKCKFAGMRFSCRENSPTERAQWEGNLNRSLRMRDRSWALLNSIR